MVGRKGQGAIEYLLILAAVLIVVAGAVYYVTRTGGFPTMTMTASIDNENNVILTVMGPSGTIKVGDWEYRGKTAAGTIRGSWTAGSEELSEGASVTLTALKTFVDAGQLGVRDKVQIRHKPSGHVYDVPIA
jgi:ABC-type transporter Mla subunit MlaD